jgi:hypothetical protein
MLIRKCPRHLQVWEGFQKSLTYYNIKNNAISQTQHVLLDTRCVVVVWLTRSVLLALTTLNNTGIKKLGSWTFIMTLFFMKGPRTTALRLFVQPQWRWWAVFLPIFTINGAPVEWNRQGKTNSEKNLSQCHFVYNKSHMDLTWDRTPGLRGERPATNRLSHGTAIVTRYSCH